MNDLKLTTQSTLTETNLNQLKHLIDSFKSIEDFDTIDQLIENLNVLIEEKKLSQKHLSTFLKTKLSNIIDGTLQGQALNKPFGYAGDFAIIDKIYTHHTNTQPGKGLWDQYFQMTAAVEAVRNRKTYFKKLVQAKIKGKSKFSILNLASGPCRDIKELLDELGEDITLDITCVDMDARAIEYAKSILGTDAKRIKFVNKNILRYTPERQYDLVWSAGLFDYFDDKVFAYLLKRMRSWMSTDGSIVIGNFNEDHNPSRAYMELFGEWYLHHRSEDQLIQLAIQAGANQSNITVGREEQNVNLFLNIKEMNYEAKSN